MVILNCFSTIENKYQSIAPPNVQKYQPKQRKLFHSIFEYYFHEWKVSGWTKDTTQRTQTRSALAV